MLARDLIEGAELSSLYVLDVTFRRGDKKYTGLSREMFAARRSWISCRGPQPKKSRLKPRNK